MITGIHAMFYTAHAEELRAFFRDKLQMPHKDAGGGWLIFQSTIAEIGCHPSDRSFQDISLMCDDIEATVEDLKGRGVEFATGIIDREYGRFTTILAPGDFKIELYEAGYS